MGCHATRPQTRQNDDVVENPRSFAAQCEQIAADVLSPFVAAAERIMKWLENMPSIVPRNTREFDPARGEQLASDLAPGMLTEELIADSPPPR